MVTRCIMNVALLIHIQVKQIEERLEKIGIHFAKKRMAADWNWFERGKVEESYIISNYSNFPSIRGQKFSCVLTHQTNERYSWKNTKRIHITFSLRLSQLTFWVQCLTQIQWFMTQRKKLLFTAHTHDIKIDIIEIENVDSVIDITPPWWSLIGDYYQCKYVTPSASKMMSQDPISLLSCSLRSMEASPDLLDYVWSGGIRISVTLLTTTS